MYVKRNYENVVFIILVAFQSLYFKCYSSYKNILTFAEGLNIGDSSNVPVMEVCILCSPILFIIIYCSEYHRMYIQQHGVLQLIRHYKKSKIVIQNIFDIGKKVLNFSLIQLCIGGILDGFVFQHEKELVIGLKSFFIYYVLVFFVVVFHLLIEYCLSHICSLLMISLYMLFSCLQSMCFKESFLSFIFPFGNIVRMRVRIIEDGFGSEIALVGVTIVYLMLSCCLLNLAFKKSDII